MHWVPAIPVKSSLKCEEWCPEVPSGSRRRTVLEEREKKGHTLGIIQQIGQSGRNPSALSYEHLGKLCNLVLKHTWYLNIF